MNVYNYSIKVCRAVRTGFPTLRLETLLLIIAATSCSVLQQTSEMKNFAKCEFRLESVTNLRLAGVNIQNKNSMSDLGLFDLTKITSAIAGGALPLTFDLNILTRNPNPNAAAMNKLDWILLIDNTEMTRGVLNDRIEIQPNSIASFPVSMNIELLKALSGKSGEALMNFAFNLAGPGGKPSRITLKAKPTIMIGNTPLQYPGYISIKQEFGTQ